MGRRSATVVAHEFTELMAFSEEAYAIFSEMKATGHWNLLLSLKKKARTAEQEAQLHSMAAVPRYCRCRCPLLLMLPVAVTVAVTITVTVTVTVAAAAVGSGAVDRCRCSCRQ